MKIASVLPMVLVALFCQAQDSSWDSLPFDVANYSECRVLPHSTSGQYPDSITEVKYAEWPVIKDGPSDLVMEMNQEIKEWVRSHIGAMEDPCSMGVRDFVGKYGSGGPFFSRVKYRIGVNRNGLFTLQLIAKHTPCCGLTGITRFTKCWNVDIAQGTILNLNDVVLPDQMGQFAKKIAMQEKEQMMHTVSADSSFDFLVGPKRINLFFHEEWGAQRFFTSVHTSYHEQQQIYQPHFLELLDLPCRFRTDIAANRKIYVRVEQEPTYPGGDEALHELMGRELAYTDMFSEDPTIVQFVVEPDGWISHSEVLSSPSPRASKEALRVIKRMDRWTAGRCKNKEVPTLYQLEVKSRY